MDKQQNNAPNKQPYQQLTIYVIGIILAACIIFRLVVHWDTTSKIIHKFFTTVSPFFIGGLIAYMINPLCKYLNEKFFPNVLKLTNKKVTKPLSILSAYCIVLGLVIIILIYVIPQLISSLLELTDTVPVTVLNVSTWLTQFTSTTPFVNRELIDELTNTIFPNILSTTTDLISKIIPMLYSASVSAIRWIINVIISLVISIYIISDKKLLSTTGKKILFSFFPEKYCLSILSTVQECNTIFSNFIVGKLIDSLIIGVLCFIAMNILSLPYSMLISVIVGVTNMIPYFGPFIGAIPGIFLLTLLNFKSGLVFAILVFILQQFDGLILGPKILGDSTGVRPLGILFAITVGGAYAGVLGMFLGVPIFAVAQYLITKLITRQLDAKHIVVADEEEFTENSNSAASEKLRQMGAILSEKIADGVRVSRQKSKNKNTEGRSKENTNSSKKDSSSAPKNSNNKKK